MLLHLLVSTSYCWAPTPSIRPPPAHERTGKAMPQPVGEGGSKLLVGDTPTSPAGGWPPPEPRSVHSYAPPLGQSPQTPRPFPAQRRYKRHLTAEQKYSKIGDGSYFASAR